ncbi:hypothetical protein [Mesonia algae]|uniref:hypothetical protein n=1 Tax=Mesonia algae TaxID=213248 RepID=UPI0014758446|nr:hypothetical protein [Mesonia algae]
MNNKLFFIFLLLKIFSVSSQETIDSDTLYVNYLGQDKGLLQVNSKAIVKDSLGFL